VAPAAVRDPSPSQPWPNGNWHGGNWDRGGACFYKDHWRLIHLLVVGIRGTFGSYATIFRRFASSAERNRHDDRNTGARTTTNRDIKTFQIQRRVVGPNNHSRFVFTSL
jgi:hypothetical protein